MSKLSQQLLNLVQTLGTPTHICKTESASSCLLSLFVQFSFLSIKFFVKVFSGATTLRIFTYGTNIRYDLLVCVTENEHPNAYHSVYLSKKKVREKSRECHNHKPQPFPSQKPKERGNRQNRTSANSNKRTKSTKISPLFPKRGNHSAKRTEKHKNKIIQGKTTQNTS